MTTRRQLTIAAGLVFVLALSVRVGHLVALRSSWSGTSVFDLPRGDAVHHWNEALDILDRNFFLTDRMLWKGPGYSYFLAGLMTVFGRSVATLRWVLAVLGALNCVGLFWLARDVLPWRWAAVTGALAALDGIVVLFDGEPLFPTLLITLNLPVLAIMGRRTASTKMLAAAGVCAGLAALVHPVYLLPALALFAWRARIAGRQAMAFGLATAFTIFPVTAQNLLQRGQLELISWSGGVNLYVGNQPGFDQACGQSTAAWGRVLSTTEAAGLTQEAQRDREYVRLAVSQFVHAPLEGMRILLEKLRILVSPVEIANNIRIYELTERSPVLAILLGHRGGLWWPFGLWLPAVVLGWVTSRSSRREDRPWLLGALTWWMAALVLSIVLSFNTARYRVPLVFFGTIWAGVWLCRLGSLVRARRVRTLAAAFVTFAAVAMLTGLGAVPQRGLPAPWQWSEARAREAAGDLPEAARAYEEALAVDPDDASLRLSVSNFYGRHGMPSRQAAILTRILALPDVEPDHLALAHEGLARAYLELKELDRAREHVRQAMLVNVDDCEWHERPYFAMGLVPATDCKLRLLAAEIELAAGDLATAGSLVETASRACPHAPDLQRQAQRIAAQIRARGEGKL